MKNWGIGGILVLALAAYGCDTANGGPIGDAGTAGTGGGAGGTAGAGGAGGAAGAGGGAGGTAGAGGAGGMAGAGGAGGMAGAGGGAGGAGGAGGMAGAGGAGGMAGAGGAGGMAGAGGGAGGAGGAGGMAGAGGGGGMAGGGGMGGAPSAASSCLDLLNDGVVVDGLYPIEVNGSPLTVYCDMSTDGGGWTQLYDQDVSLGYLPTTTWAAGVSTTPANMGQYSILNLIDEFEFEDGSSGFDFFIDWPDPNEIRFVQWEQSTNPFNGRGTVSNIVESPGNQSGCTLFSGLGNDGGVFSTLNGSDTNACQFWSIGTSVAYGVGIPAYSGSDLGALVATQTRLWVR